MFWNLKCMFSNEILYISSKAGVWKEHLVKSWAKSLFSKGNYPLPSSLFYLFGFFHIYWDFYFKTFWCLLYTVSLSIQYFTNSKTTLFIIILLVNLSSSCLFSGLWMYILFLTYYFTLLAIRYKILDIRIECIFLHI